MNPYRTCKFCWTYEHEGVVHDPEFCRRIIERHIDAAQKETARWQRRLASLPVNVDGGQVWLIVRRRSSP